MLRVKSVAGPTSYASGGFTITFGEVEKILNAAVQCDRSQILEASDTAYGLRVTFTGNTVRVVVVVASTVGAGPNAWAEIATGTNLSARTFTAVVDAI